jgi:hypothetical protein
VKKKRSGSRLKKVWGRAEVHKVDAKTPEDFRRLFGPGTVDQMVRHALQVCWMVLPASANKLDEVEQEFRRIVDRALRDQREDQGKWAMAPGN